MQQDDFWPQLEKDQAAQMGHLQEVHPEAHWFDWGEERELENLSDSAVECDGVQDYPTDDFHALADAQHCVEFVEYCYGPWHFYCISQKQKNK